MQWAQKSERLWPEQGSVTTYLQMTLGKLLNLSLLCALVDWTEPGIAGTARGSFMAFRFTDPSGVLALVPATQICHL